jgi:hypothetical protein
MDQSQQQHKMPSDAPVRQQQQQQNMDKDDPRMALEEGDPIAQAPLRGHVGQVSDTSSKPSKVQPDWESGRQDALD